MSFSRQHLLSTLAPAVWHVLSGMWCLDIRAYAYQLIAWSVCVQTCCILVASSVASSILLHTSSTPPDLLQTSSILVASVILVASLHLSRDARREMHLKVRMPNMMHLLVRMPKIGSPTHSHHTHVAPTTHHTHLAPHTSRHACERLTVRWCAAASA